MGKSELRFIVVCILAIIIWAVMAIKLIEVRNEINNRSAVVVKILERGDFKQ